MRILVSHSPVPKADPPASPPTIEPGLVNPLLSRLQALEKQWEAFQGEQGKTQQAIKEMAQLIEEMRSEKKNTVPMDLLPAASTPAVETEQEEILPVPEQSLPQKHSTLLSRMWNYLNDPAIEIPSKPSHP